MKRIQTDRPANSKMVEFFISWGGTIVAMAIAAVLLSMLIK